MDEIRKVGRPRIADGDKQAAILTVASHLFASIGYEKTTIRLVAQKCGVDPKLVMHYFGNKQQLFIACLKVPVEAEAAIALTKTLPKSKWGWAIAELVWEIQEQADHPLLSLMRAAVSDEVAASMTREFYIKAFIDGFATSLNVDNRELRMMMVSSFVSGYTFSNRVLGVFDAVPVSDLKKKTLFASGIQAILTTKL